MLNASGNEIATPAAAQDFFDGTYPTPAMQSACRMIFDRLRNGGGNQPSVYRFNSRFGGGKTHTLIALAAMARHPQMVQSGAVKELLAPERFLSVLGHCVPLTSRFWDSAVLCHSYGKEGGD